MEPALLVGDYLFVSKLSYGFSRHSLPFGLPLFSGRILFSEPEVGDVAVFAYPRDNKTYYIKRIVGLPGDKIEVREGILHINDRSEEHTSELQSLMRISYAVSCLKKKTERNKRDTTLGN